MNLDSPCECGIDNQVGGCINLASIWTSEILEETSPGMSLAHSLMTLTIKILLGSLTWVAHKEAPEGGKYLAFFVSLQYKLPSNDLEENEISLEFTTSTAVVPDQFPFKECHGEQCFGNLL